jgi:hypothetical protein
LQLQLILNLSHQESSQQRLNALTLSMHNRSSSSNSSSTSVNMSDVRDAVLHLKERAGVKPLSGNDILELFSNLFGQDQWKEKGVVTPRGSYHVTGNKASSMSSGHSSSDVEDLVVGGSPISKNRQTKENCPPSSSATPVKDASFEFGSPIHSHGDMEIVAEVRTNDGGLVAGEDNMVTTYAKGKTNGHNSGNAVAEGDGKVGGIRFDQMESALDMLRQVDIILEQLGVFWANTEVVLDALTKKGQHAEHFVGFARNPKLMQRFKDRINEYRYRITH